MRRVARHLGSKWMNSPNLPQHMGAVVARLRQLAFRLVAFSAVLMLFGAVTFSLNDPTAIIVGIILATTGFTTLAALDANRVQTAVIVQSLSLSLCGLAIFYFHSEGRQILLTFLLLSATHWATFGTRLYRHPQRPIEMVLSICLGAMIMGAIFSAPNDLMTVCGALSAICVVGSIGLQWSALSGFAVNERNLPIARVNEIQKAIERMGSGIAQFGADGSLLSASPLLSQLLNCQPYSLRDKGFMRRIHLLDQPAFLKQISDVTHSRLTRTVEVRIQADDTAAGGGSRFLWMEISATCASILVGQGEDSEAIIVFREITERKERHQELEDARIKAEQAAHTKTRFLATVGHELRTPLNAVVGFSEMMVNGIGGDLSPSHQEYAGHIKDSGRHLLEVVNMLLDMSKIEAGKFELDLSEFMPDRIIAPVTNMVDVQAKAKSLEMNLDIQDNLPLIVADERALRQVLINLMSNATKFSNVGGEISVTARRQGTKIMLCVRDYGVGMSTEDVDRLGEPFFQAAQGLGRRYEGTGLGLSIVKGLIELHEGSLHIDSQLGKGTSVTVLLPMAGPKPAEIPSTEITDLNQSKQQQVTSEQWQQQQSAENHQEKRNVAS